MPLVPRCRPGGHLGAPRVALAAQLPVGERPQVNISGCAVAPAGRQRAVAVGGARRQRPVQGAANGPAKVRQLAEAVAETRRRRRCRGLTPAKQGEQVAWPTRGPRQATALRCRRPGQAGGQAAPTGCREACFPAPAAARPAARAAWPQVTGSSRAGGPPARRRGPPPGRTRRPRRRNPRNARAATSWARSSWRACATSDCTQCSPLAWWKNAAGADGLRGYLKLGTPERVVRPGLHDGPGRPQVGGRQQPLVAPDPGDPQQRVGQSRRRRS